MLLEKSDGARISRWSCGYLLGVFLMLGAGCPDSTDEAALEFFDAQLATSPERMDNPKWLFLHRQTCCSRPSAITNGVLRRELFRQAFLIAAEHEIVVATQDAAVRETVPAGSGLGMELGIDVFAADGFAGYVDFYEMESGRTAAHPFHRAHVDTNNSSSYLTLLEQADSASRSEFVDVLLRLGYERSPAVRADDGTVPVDLLSRFNRIEIVGHIEALREIHALIAESGESPERLGALSRGYANLGILTSHLWSPIHKVLWARSLLYASRIQGVFESHSLAREHLAYAWAMAGRHADALDALAFDNVGFEDNASPWRDLISAYCRFDLSRLLAIADSQDVTAEWAHFLYLIALEHSDSYILKLRTAEQLVERYPHCMRGWDILCALEQTHGIGRSISPAMTALEDTIAPISHWRALSAEAIDSRGALIEHLVSQRLASQNDPGPSLQFLGRVIEELTFAQAYRYLDQPNGPSMLAYPYYAQQIQLELPDHPFLCVLEGISEHNRHISPCRGQYVVDCELDVVQRINRALPNNKTEQVLGYEPGPYCALVQCDAISSDMFSQYHGDMVPSKKTVARQWIDVSPHHPAAMTALIWYDRRAVPLTQLEAWLNEHSDYPILWAAAAKYYEDLHQFHNAERCLQRAIDLSPDFWSYRTLGNLFLKNGDTERTAALMKSYLDAPDPGGANHANANIWLSQHYLDKEQPDIALEYAESAAKHPTQMGMLMAMFCKEHLGDFDGAHDWVRRAAQQYEACRPIWYLWCYRTGHGDIELALRSATEVASSASNDEEFLDSMGTMQLVRGNNREAVAYFERLFWQNGKLVPGIHAALLSDQIGDSFETQRLLNGILRYRSKTKGWELYNSPMFELAQLLLDRYAMLDRDPTLKFSIQDSEVDRFMVGLSDHKERHDAAFLIARFILMHGDRDEAMKLIQVRAAEWRGEQSCRIAAIRLVRGN